MFDSTLQRPTQEPHVVRPGSRQECRATTQTYISSPGAPPASCSSPTGHACLAPPRLSFLPSASPPTALSFILGAFQPHPRRPVPPAHAHHSQRSDRRQSPWVVGRLRSRPSRTTGTAPCKLRAWHAMVVAAETDPSQDILEAQRRPLQEGP